MNTSNTKQYLALLIKCLLYYGVLEALYQQNVCIRIINHAWLDILY